MASPGVSGGAHGDAGTAGRPSDLLLRFFESDFFDEWIAVQYLYQNNSPGVHAYLCNKLFQFPDHKLDRYLLQLIYVALQRPGGCLEKTIVQLCAKSFKLAVKVHWLLLAMLQDNPKDRHVLQFKDACGLAALGGEWEVPFRSPLSPLVRASSGSAKPLTIAAAGGGGMAHAASFANWVPGTSPPGGSPVYGGSPPYGSSPPSAAVAEQRQLQPQLLGRSHAPLAIDLSCLRSSHDQPIQILRMAHDANPAAAALGAALRPLRSSTASEDGSSQQLHLVHDGGAEPSGMRTPPNARVSTEHSHHGGHSNWPLQMSMPVSPTTRLRQDTYGATLDFVEALCDASSSLTAYSQEERHRALRLCLEAINREIEFANARNVSIWFPLGAYNERVVRLAAQEAVLLNSREKAPFMLFVEVLAQDEAAGGQAGGRSPSPSSSSAAAAAANILPTPPLSAFMMPAVAASALSGRLPDSAAAPPPPQEQQQPKQQQSAVESPLSPHHRPTDSAVSLQPSVGCVSDDSAFDAALLATASTSAAPYGASSSGSILPATSSTGITLHSMPSLSAMLAGIGLGPASPCPSGTTPTTSAGLSPSCITTMAGSSIEGTPAHQAAADYHQQNGSSDAVGGSSPRSGGSSSGGGGGSSSPSKSKRALFGGDGGAAPTGNAQLAGTMYKSQIDYASAALRGQAPLVRLHITVLDNCQPQQPHQHQQDAVTASSEASGASSSQYYYNPQQLSTLSSAAGDAAVSSLPWSLPLLADWGRPMPAMPAGTTVAASSSAAAAGSASGAHPPGSPRGLVGSLVSKLSLCGKLPEDGGAGPASADHGGGSGHVLSTWSSSSLPPPAKLVSVRLDVAGGLNLAISSPQRRSRRMPSHEALDLIAGRFKVSQIPPPYECGPPLARPTSSSATSSPDQQQQLNGSAWPSPSTSGGSPARPASATRANCGPGGGPSILSQFALAQAATSGQQQQQQQQPASLSSSPQQQSQQSLLSLSRFNLWGWYKGNGPQSALPSPQGAAATQPPYVSPLTRAGQQQPHVSSAAAAGPLSQPPAASQQSPPGSSPRAPVPPALPPASPAAASSSPVLTAPPAGSVASDCHEPVAGPGPASAASAAQLEASAVYGERWEQRVARLQRESPQGRRKGWALRCVIVKTGDDCRQELLSVQLIRTFAEIFADAGLPLWVRPYDVLVTSSRTALIEFIPDTLSVHTVKSRSPPGTSLSDHFFAKFPRGSAECAAAQRRFTESLAAYSIICYILQIKDRHNGNILIDDAGRVIHIDFGFLLSNSPGGVNFEAAPFKLTRELLEVMDSNSEGRPSELFDYFKVLCIQGFLAARKYQERVLMMVKIMSRSGLPCFKAGDKAVKGVERRLHLGLTELQCVQVVLGLISDSLDAWRTRQYDYYQRVLNGIL